MRLNWQGNGQKLYPLAGWQQPPLALLWARLSGEMVYRLLSYKYAPPKTILELRIPDYNWQDREPRIFGE